MTIGIDNEEKVHYTKKLTSKLLKRKQKPFSRMLQVAGWYGHIEFCTRQYEILNIWIYFESKILISDKCPCKMYKENV